MTEVLPRPNNLDGVRVLLVEDHQDTQDALRMILETQGALVFTAGSAVEGMKVFLESHPDVLVCDLGLPGVDGYMLLRQIRALPGALGGQVGAVAVTAHAAELSTKVLHAGFQVHLAKPVEPLDLVGAVNALASRAKQ
jgi:CheY-like chemotaxis protein